MITLRRMRPGKNNTSMAAAAVTPRASSARPPPALLLSRTVPATARSSPTAVRLMTNFSIGPRGARRRWPVRRQRGQPMMMAALKASTKPRTGALDRGWGSPSQGRTVLRTRPPTMRARTVSARAKGSLVPSPRTFLLSTLARSRVGRPSPSRSPSAGVTQRTFAPTAIITLPTAPATIIAAVKRS